MSGMNSNMVLTNSTKVNPSPVSLNFWRNLLYTFCSDSPSNSIIMSMVAAEVAALLVSAGQLPLPLLWSQPWGFRAPRGVVALSFPLYGSHPIASGLKARLVTFIVWLQRVGKCIQCVLLLCMRLLMM